MRRLAQLAYSDATEFIATICDTYHTYQVYMWQRTPKTLDDAVFAAVDVETFNQAEVQKNDQVVRSAMALDDTYGEYTVGIEQTSREDKLEEEITKLRAELKP